VASRVNKIPVETPGAYSNPPLYALFIRYRLISMKRWSRWNIDFSAEQLFSSRVSKIPKVSRRSSNIRSCTRELPSISIDIARILIFPLVRARRMLLQIFHLRRLEGLGAERVLLILNMKTCLKYVHTHLFSRRQR